MNCLYYGDNLDILRRYIPSESIDLIYLDPPFNSKATYNVLFSEKNGRSSEAQIKAFEDTWHWDRSAEDTYLEIVEDTPQKLADLVKALRSFLGQNDMMAYLVVMAIRLVELHRVLKSTWTIYLHCDPTASHFLKPIMDSIFGGKNFRNEIVWSYKRYTATSKRFQRLHDILFFYTKGDVYTFNEIRIPYGDKSGIVDSHYKQDKKGLWFRWQKRKGKKPYKIYLSEGRRLGDVWEIPIINASAKERLGYPTQKPEALLERIIKASSNEGDIVLDPFCGCGTTVVEAEKLKRKWIGIDITHLAISLMKHRLRDTFGDTEYEVKGEPTDLKGAETLKEEDPYQFQWWALGLVGARPAESEKKKGADKGIDGYIYFHDDPKKLETKKIIIQVKGGHIGVHQINELKGVMEKEQAQIGVFITLNKPTKPMVEETISAGYYTSPLNHIYPRIQILTIAELLEGKKIVRPFLAPEMDITFRKARRYKEKKQIEMRY